MFYVINNNLHPYYFYRKNICMYVVLFFSRLLENQWNYNYESIQLIKDIVLILLQPNSLLLTLDSLYSITNPLYIKKYKLIISSKHKILNPLI